MTDTMGTPAETPEPPQPDPNVEPMDAGMTGAAAKKQSPDELVTASAPPGPDDAPKTPDAGAVDIPTSSDSNIPTVPVEAEKGIHGEIKKIADDYVIPMSPPGIKQWAKALKGKDIKEFKDYAQQVAIGLYPTFAPQLQQGLATRVLLDPYVEMAEMVLGPQMTEPDWTDPKWAKALQGGVDEKTGRPMPLPLDEWKQSLMRDPEHNWEYTPDAHQKANNLINHIQKEFSSNEGQE